MKATLFVKLGFLLLSVYVLSSGIGLILSGVHAETVNLVPAAATTFVPPYSTYPDFTVPPAGTVMDEYNILVSLYKQFYGPITEQCSFPIQLFGTPRPDGSVAAVTYTYPCYGGNAIFATIIPGVPAHCPTGFTRQGDFCNRPDPPAKNSGCGAAAAMCGDPINAATGNAYQVVTDYQGAGPFPLTFSRSYNSLYPITGTRLGTNWQDSLEPDQLHFTCGASYTYYANGAQHNICDYWEAVLTRADGSQLDFFLPYSVFSSFSQGIWDQSGSNASVSPVSFESGELDSSGNFVDVSAGNTLQLTAQGYQLQDSSGRTEQFDTTGRLLSVTALGGYSHFYHDDAAGNLISVSDEFGRSLGLTYDSEGRISTVTNPSGGVYTYSYDANGELASVKYPDGTIIQYLYEDSAFPHALTGIIDQNGNRYATWSYDSQGRAVSSVNGANAGRVGITYDSDGSADVTEATGLVRHLGFQILFGIKEFIQASAPCPDCGDKSQSVTYDGNGYVSSATDFDGNVTDYMHDASGLETSRAEAVGTPEQRTITTQWDVTLREPTLVTEPGRTTAYSYDSIGRMLSKTITDTSTGVNRTTTYNYNGQGLLSSVTDPLGHVTSFSYDSQGNLSSVTNALGQVTQITKYDANGLPLTIIDPNGAETDLAYDARQRLTSRTVAGATTTFTYDAAGNLTRVTLPTGAYLKYAYDAAHRLTAISDNLGDTLSYTLDAFGNRIAEQTSDPTGHVTRTLSRVYDDLNHLVKTIGGAGQTTLYTDDLLGNPTAITDPLGHVAGQVFDPLNRLVTSVDPGNGNTTYNHDALNRITDVTDPRGLNTHYVYDAFGDVTEQQSPDTGATTYSYDLDGNRLTKTDARGITASYSYDALNRLTGITYPNAAEDVTYSYDQGTNGVGRLTAITDQSGSTGYQYDARGNLIQKTVTIGGHAFTVSYAYDADDNLTGLTYPDGTQVTYNRDAAERISSVQSSSGGTVVSGITYEPFGPVTGLTYGNGLAETRGYDQDYRLTSLTDPNIQSWTLGHNADDDITAIIDALNSTNSQSLGYDALNRLTNAQGSYGSLGYSYDADGNRLQQTLNGTHTAYGYATTSNQLLSVGSANEQYDAAGNLINDSIHSYSYNDAGRLAGYDANLNVYLYNGLGQRVQKPSPVIPGDANGDGVINPPDLIALQQALKGEIPVTPGMDCNQDGVVDNKDKSCIAQQIGNYKNQGKGNGTSASGGSSATASSLYLHFVYDESGHLLGEYDQNGNPIEEHIWLNDRPIGVITPSGLYYVQTDQLGTPRAITNSSQQLVWQWNSDPFGTNAPNQNPSGLGTFVYNLRFPGQYYDAETSHNYNYFRDYDPSIGRYIESDPIGLFGGINTYAYANGDPIIYIDRYGLCWIYSQSTGHLSHVDIYGNSDYVAYGYAGYGIFANDSNLQSVPNVGPLPQGYYTIGPEQTNHIDGGRVALLNSMRLTPDPFNEMFGRGGFLIHGAETNDTNRESSEGCPVFDKKTRDKIGSSKDKCFIVVP